MTEFTITLPEHTHSQIYNREKFISVFPESMISILLEQSADTEIIITQRFVLPEVLTILHLVIEKGQVTYQPHDELREDVKKSADYLCIDLLAVVNDPKFQNLQFVINGIDLTSPESIQGHADSLIHHACQAGFVPLLRHLLAHGVDPSLDNDLALRHAYHSEIIRIILADPRTNPSIYNNSVMIRACDRGDMDLVRRLLAHPRIDASTGFFNVMIHIGTRHRPNTEIFKLIVEDPRTDLSRWCDVYVRPIYRSSVIFKMVDTWLREHGIPHQCVL